MSGAATPAAASNESWGRIRSGSLSVNESLTSKFGVGTIRAGANFLFGVDSMSEKDFYRTQAAERHARGPDAPDEEIRRQCESLATQYSQLAEKADRDDRRRAVLYGLAIAAGAFAVGIYFF